MVERTVHRPSPAPSRLRSQIRQTQRVTVMLLVALACLEGLARLWETRPAEQLEGPEPVAALTPPPPRSPNTFRVFAFGSSCVYGIPLPELGFISQLEFWLRRSAPHLEVEVYNFAVPARDSSHVLARVRQAIEWQPDLVFVHTGGSEFFHRETRAGVALLYHRAANHSALLRAARRIVWQVAEAARPGLSAPSPPRPWDRRSPEFEERAARYRDNLAALIDAVVASDTPLLLGTVISNLADWPPVKRYRMPSHYDDRYRSTISTIDHLLSADDLPEASRRIGQALERYPDDAMLLFQLGKAHAASGEPDLARELFYRARDLDPIPWRVLSEFNEIVRRSAAAGVHVVDLERALEDHAPQGLVGFSLIADLAHPTPRGSSILAGAVLREMARHGIAISPEAGVFALEDPLPVFMEHAARQAAPRDLESEFLLGIADFCMFPLGRQPDQRYEVARLNLLRGLAHDPDDWRMWANLASVSFFEGRHEEGKDELRRAIALKGTVDGIDGRQARHLKKAMRQARIRLDSVLTEGEVR